MEKELLAEGTDYRGDTYVLCYLPKKKEFATWFKNDKGNTVLGNYLITPEDGIKNFKEKLSYGEKSCEIDWKLPKEEVMDLEGWGNM